MRQRAAAESHPDRQHVLFLNAQDGLGADVAVHLSLARSLDRHRLRISAATSLQEQPGASARRMFEAIPDMTLLTLDLGRPVGRYRGRARAVALVHNVRAVASLAGLARWCRANSVDVIHVTERPRQALFGLMVARLAGCACLIHAHTVHQARDATRLANWRLHEADAVVGVSRFVARSIQHSGKLPANRVFTVHNAVDGRVFRPHTELAGRLHMRERLGIPADAPLVGCVARLMRWKGQGTLLEAFVEIRRNLPGARLVLAGVSSDVATDGHGDYRDYLLRRIDALGLHDAVTLPGFVQQSEMPDFYAALDILAHPAIEEPFGLAVVEAMASSRPVVAVEAGGIPEIVRHGVDGLLVPPGEASAMAESVTRVLCDADLADRLGRAGRERVLATFTPEIQAAAMENVYAQIGARR